MTALFDALWRLVLGLVSVMAALIRMVVVAFAASPTSIRRRFDLHGGFVDELQEFDPCYLRERGELERYEPVAREAYAAAATHGRPSVAVCRNVIASALAFEFGECEPSNLELRRAARHLAARVRRDRP